jgi:hypothetical protein
MTTGERCTEKEDCECSDCLAWNDYEEDGVVNLEDQLDASLERAFGGKREI